MYIQMIDVIYTCQERDKKHETKTNMKLIAHSHHVHVYMPDLES